MYNIMSDKVPDFLREFDDAKAARRNIYDNTLEAMKKRFPVEDDNYRLELNDLHYDGPLEYSLAEQKKALLHNRNLRTNLVGTWRLVDKKTGNVIDERKDSVMQVPYWTDRGTFINNGSEYTVISQSRLRPGVYARRKSNGELEAQFNIRPGTGRGFHIGLQPETGVMTLQTGQGSMPLYQILRGMGVDDKAIIKAWGADVAKANSEKVDAQAWSKLYKRMAGYKAVPNATEADKIQFVKDAVSAYEVDPEVIERTMGLRNVSTVTPELLLRASQKVLNVSRGDEKPDNRDNPRFSKFYGVEDYFKERVEKNAGRLANTLLYKARRNGSLKGIQRNALNPWVDTIINGSGLAMPGEEANPLSTLEQMSRISKFGLGGIGSKDAVTMEARDVQGDYLGFVDMNSGPECFVAGSFIMTKSGYIKVEDVDEATELACLVDGRLEYHKPERVIAEDYDGLIYCASSKLVNYKVTPGHRIWHRMYAGSPNYRFRTAAEVHGKHIMVMTGGHAPYPGTPMTTFTLPHVEKLSNHQKPDLPPIDIEVWGAFLGWFLSEGNVSGKNVRITQSKPDHIAELEYVISQIPCPYSRYEDDFIISDMQLSSYLGQFGHSWEKYIPEYMFEAPVAARKAMLDALCYGDGRRKRDTYTYCTISKRLAVDVERLCFSLGLSANVRFEEDKRWIARRTGGSWAVHINMRQERQLIGKRSLSGSNYSVERYSGKVYCVTVPGGTVYARYGERGGHWTGNSEAIGVDVRAAYRTFLGKDNKLYGEFIDNRTGKKEFVDIATAADRLVAFPGQDPKSPYLMAIKDGIPQRVPRDEVRYTVPSYGHMITSNTNMNPMPTGVQPTRQFYGSKFWSQYLPQAKGEVPLIDSLMPDGKMTWSEYYGRKVGTLGADADGVVTKVEDDMITIKGNDGKIYKKELVKNIPFNRLSGISYFPAVEVGQAVKAGDMIAHSNFTDRKTGAINMGQNLRACILPLHGQSYEDAYTISESAAKRLATDRLYSFDHETRNGVTIGRNKYVSAFPSKFTKEQVETLDENGVVKPGTVLHRGDPIVLSLGPKMLSSQDKALGKLSKVLRNSYTDRSETWEHDYEGKVVDAAVTSKGVKVNVSAQPPVRVGDKLSPFGGLKGVVGRIYPDEEMPRDAVTNQPYEVAINPMGFLSRVAPNQLMELSLAKVAKKTGKQIRMPQLPPPEGWYRWTQAQMKAAGIPETADVFDPGSGKTIKGVGDGYIYLHAFHHLAEKKASSAGVDGSYTQDEQPAKGGVEGAKKMCFVSHQAIKTLHGEEHIGYIVEKRVRELVWTRFEDGYWGYAPVTNWFVRKGKMSDVLSIQINYLPQENHGSLKSVTYGRKNICVTKNHEIYTPSGKTCAGALKPGDFVATYGYVPTNDQISLLYGSMLGDAAICGIDEVSPYYLDQHSDKQSNYVWWKIRQLGTLVGSRKITGKKSKCGFNGGTGRTAFYTVNRPDITIPLRDAFYRGPGGFVKKTIKNVDLDSLTDVALVAWFLDDGCTSIRERGGLSGNISTMGFSEDDVDTLAAWLSSRLGVECHRGKYNDIRMGTAACEAMAKIVARYMTPDDIPSTKKWLISKVKEYASLFTGVDTAYTLGTIGALVASVEPYSDGLHGPDDEINLYDITVDGSHKYCASDVLVSNSGMDLWGMLSHNVPDVIKDSQAIRGTRNDQYWRALQLGLPVPEPEEPFIYKKFLNTLRAGGVNVTEKGAITKIMPQTDKDVDQLAQGRVITSSEMLDSDFEPMKGGLFDLGKTGGMGGNQWSMIQLPEPVPNPIMEEPVRRLLGLTSSKMEDILSGREKLDGKTGGEALKSALSKIDVDKRIEESKRGITTLRGQKRDDVVKIYRYLTAMKQQGLKPQDWMVSKVPVLPPAFRPVSKMGDVALVSDMNELYKDIIENANNFNELKKDVSDDGLSDERLNIYNSVKAAYGLGEPITPENAAKGVKGAMRQIIGSRPKFGMFQNKVLSKAVNGVARGVISPDPNLDMDQCGIPEVMAWNLYKPYIMRELVRNGYPNVTAVKMIADKTDTAKNVMRKVMEQRPVILDRAPTWHKFNLLAFRPTLTDGATIKVSPLITSGFTADFDGDQMNAHVPSSEKAVQQAYEKMLPSKNLTSLTDLKSPRHTPSKEQIFGLYALTKGMDTKKPVKVFNSVSEAKQAYARGEIGPNDPIEIRR